MNYYEKACRVIENLISKGRKRFILFPFGERGMLIKRLLNERYGIMEEGIIDNGLSKIREGEIYPISILQEKNLDDVIILLTSDNEAAYSELRYQLMQYVSIEQFVDVFSISQYFDEKSCFDEMEQTPGDEWRIRALELAAKEIYCNGVQGAIAECGVYKGAFANWMSRIMPDRKLYLFDTFSGFDKRDLEEESAKSNRILSDTLFDNGSVEESLGTIGYRANCIVKKGYFPETITEDVRLESFAFVSLDMDLYRPILEGLNFFWDRLSPGGSIFVDDFRSEDFPGATQAVVEFCEKNQVAYVNVSLGGGRGKSLAVISKPLG